MRWIFITPVIFLIYGGVCFYTGKRLLDFSRCFAPNMKAAAFWLVFALLCVILLFSNFIRHNLNFLRTAGSVWLAFLLYMLLFLALSDIARLFLFTAGKKIPNINLYLVGAAIFLCALLIIYGVFHARSIKTVNYDIKLRNHWSMQGDQPPGIDSRREGDNDPLRIVLLSDLHIGSLIGEAWIGRVVDAVNKAQPDIVCIAGDIFDGNLDAVRDLPGVISQLQSLKAPLGVYAVLGNHDIDRMSFNDARTQRIEEALKAADIVLLKDEVREIRRNLYIAGRKDARPIGMSADRLSASELLSGINGTIIMLDHQPVDFEQIEKAAADLLFCGHTHKGQVFPSTLITRGIFKNMGSTYYGYWQGNTMQAVVTSGAGVWGPPLRIGTNSEIAVINLEFVIQ